MRQTEERAGRPRLASLEFLGNPDDLRTETVRSLRRSGGVAPAFHHEGADGTGTIWVMVDGRGRVYSVEIPRRWRERIAVPGFAAALFEAYRTAVEKALTAAALVAYVTARQPDKRQPDKRQSDKRQPDKRQPDKRQSDKRQSDKRQSDKRQSDKRQSDKRQPDKEPAASRRWAAPVAAEPAARGSGPWAPEPDLPEWLRASQATLDGVTAELARLSRIETSTGAGERLMTSPNGYLTLRILGQGLVGITGDDQRIRAADSEQLRLDALAAFRAAALATNG